MNAYQHIGCGLGLLVLTEVFIYGFTEYVVPSTIRMFVNGRRDLKKFNEDCKKD